MSSTKVQFASGARTGPSIRSSSPPNEIDLDLHVDEDQRSLPDRMESAERVTRSAEALRALKPDEARALLLKAKGLSAELGERPGWTYTNGYSPPIAR